MSAAATLPVPAVRAALPGRPREVLDTVLDNGLRLLIARAPAVPVVQVRLGIPFGGTDPLHAATAEVLAATLLAGTTTSTRAELDAAIAQDGGVLKTVVGPELLRVTGQVLADGVPDLLRVLAQCLSSAAYPEATVAAEQRRVLDRVRLAESMPALAARAALLRHCFGTHPVTRETPAYADVEQVTREQVWSLHATQVVPAGSVLVLVGDVDPAGLADTVATAFEGWRSVLPARRMAALSGFRGAGVAPIARAGARQTEIRLAAPALHRTDPDYPALALAVQVFGGGFSARLVQELRERRGLVYSGHAALEERAGSGLTMVQFACAPTQAEAALAATMAELAGVSRIRPPDDEEIAAARGNLLGTRAIALATQTGLADALSALACADLGDPWLDWFDRRIRGVPADQVRAVAERQLAPDTFAGILLGPTDPVP